MRKFLLILFSLSTLHLFAISNRQVTEVLNKLDKELEQRQTYILARQQHIDSLVAVADVDSMNVELLMEIADAYTSFNSDSAMVFLSKGIKLTRGAERLHFKWKYAAQLPLNGFFDSAISIYESIDEDSVPAHLKEDYYEAGRQMHSYVASFFVEYPPVSIQHNQEALMLQRKLLNVVEPDTESYNYQLGEYYFGTGRPQMAKVLLAEIVENNPSDSHLRARAAHHLANIAKGEDDHNSYIYYLALSAIADITSATREAISLQELGSDIFNHGDVVRAHKYLSAALASAVECGASLRMVESSRSLPIIEQAHERHVAEWRNATYWIIALLVGLLFAIAATLLVLRHEMNNMKVLQQKLRSANDTKEVYISQFLRLCSIYMDKLNSLCKIITRKLASGQGDELYRMTKSGKFVEEQSKEFYDVFDNAFLHICPDFVEGVNKLLLPDQQIELQPGELLNTDLRILAFIRLGIEESPRIAQVLNYSLNTIYAYRNRLKARAINRDTFEADILKIGTTHGSFI